MEIASEAWIFCEHTLPPAVAELIFSFLSLEDIVHVSVVCKAWNRYFDTKDIWKKISEHYYGELSSKNVDLTQTFRWKRIFIALSNAHRWAKTFSALPTSYTHLRQDVGPTELGPSGQYLHMRLCSVNVKMAGEIVHTKREPRVYHDRQWLVKFSPGVLETEGRLLASDGKGKFLFEDRLGSKIWNLYNSEQCVTSSNADHHVTQLSLLPVVGNKIIIDAYVDFPAHLGSFNSHYVVLATTTKVYHKKPIPHVIFDLQSTCAHVQPFYKDVNQQKKHEIHHTGEVLCKDHRLNTPFGVLGVFASQLVPEKIVFMMREPDPEKSAEQDVFYPKLAIWTASKGLNEKDGFEFKHDEETEVKNFSEHVIDGYHWLCFDMGQHTRIINLNNFANQFKLDLIERRMWVPNKNKIVLVSGKKVTVLDLQLNRWTSRMTCPNDVRAMTFNKSARLLFVADTEFIHAFHWETAKLVGSVQHPFAVQTYRQISTLHMAYDQVIIINGDTFLRMPTKCSV